MNKHIKKDVGMNAVNSYKRAANILDKEDIAWRTQYPNIAKKLDSLEQRLHKLESKK